MKAKTGQQIENDIYAMFQMGSLPGIIGGMLYKYGMRPKDSETEDAVVRFVTCLPGQVQDGTAVVNIYVPDVKVYNDGIMRKNIARCTELEQAAEEWVQSLSAAKSDYLFELAQTIYTEEEPDIHQHFITIRLKYKLSTI